MNMCQKILFPSLINEGTSRMLQWVQRKILRTSIYMQMRNAEMNLQAEDATAQLIPVSMDKNHGPYYQFPTSYAAVK